MEEIKRKIEDKIEQIKGYFKGSEKIESKVQVKKKHSLNLLLLVILVVAAFILSLMFVASDNGDKLDMSEDSIDLSEHETIELGTDGTKGEVKWQNFLEESIEEESSKRQEQIDLLKNSLNNNSMEQKSESSKEFEEIKSRLSYALNELERLQIENKNIRDDIVSLENSDEDRIMPAELGLTPIASNISTKAPASSYNHIPATSYVSGHLLGGISVSTSVNSASEPIPVIIKLTGRGNLPADFAVDLKQCRLLASCYGDISSERAIIRAEELICEDKEAGMFTSTKVAGVIYGDDGANGIHGTVVSMSEKHLKNAFIGGVLSGFSGTSKGQQGFDITSIGAISSKKRGAIDMAKDGLMSGTATAAEKLADYHIRLAENISPVILVPGGTKVDVMFTRSVQIGSFDVEDAINSERGGQ